MWDPERAPHEVPHAFMDNRLVVGHAEIIGLNRYTNQIKYLKLVRDV